MASSPVHFSLIGGTLRQAPVGGPKGDAVLSLIKHLWNDESGQDIAEYAVLLAVILVIVVGTIRLIGSRADAVFSSVGSSIH